MVPTSRLAEALFPGSRAAILAVLDSAGDEGLHLREVTRRTSLNSKTVMRELHSLRGAGVLTSRDVGRQVIYRLDPSCPIAPELRAIIRKTVGIAGILRAALEPLSARIEHAYIYGSIARGEERADSDIDLMVVGAVSLRELSSPVREAGRSLLRAVKPTLYTREEYRRELKDKDSFVSRVHRGARIDLLGGPR